MPFALAAFLIWGGWAFYANEQAGYLMALVSAFAQGVFSMLMTLFMGYLISFFFIRLSHPMVRLFMPAILVFILASVCLSFLHLR